MAFSSPATRHGTNFASTLSTSNFPSKSYSTLFNKPSNGQGAYFMDAWTVNWCDRLSNSFKMFVSLETITIGRDDDTTCFSLGSSKFKSEFRSKSLLFEFDQNEQTPCDRLSLRLG